MTTDFSLYNTDSNVKYIHSDLSGAPLLNYEYGSLNSVLKMVLCEGFNDKIVESISRDTSTGLSTIKLPLNHGFTFNTVISISGALQEEFNQEFRVLEATAQTVLVHVTSSSSLAIATTDSNITAKVAPLGYSIAYENPEEGVICFKNSSTKSPAILKVIDKLPPNGYLETWSKYGRVTIGQEIDVSGNFINNEKAPYSAEFPDIEKTGNNITGQSGIHGFAKWDYVIPTNRTDTAEHYGGPGTYPTNWRIIGDSDTFYLMIRSMGRNSYSYNLLGFGNYASENSSETTNTCLQARDGYHNTDYTGEYNYARTRNKFPVYNTTYAGFLLSNIYGSVRNTSNYGRYLCQGLYLSGNEAERPWRSNSIRSVNPTTGDWITSKIYIRDYDNYIRGYHRGISVVYGTENLPDQTSTRSGDLILHVQTPLDNGQYEVMPLAFTLRNWEAV